jgi:ATP-dependent DNA helicase RecQ
VAKNEVRKQLLSFIRTEHPADAGIVYALSRKTVEQTAEFLKNNGLNALPYHAGLDAGVRAHTQSRFLREEGVIIVATIAFGMGIDKPDVRFVAHIDLPKSVEGYYQETGRAGRDGAPANAWLAYGLQDVVQQRRMIDQSPGDLSHRRTLSGHLDAMLALCETVDCRRVNLLRYFGQSSTPCGNCDTCIEPPAAWDGTVPAQKLLSTIVRLLRERNQRFGAGHLIDILRGKETPRATQYGHAELKTWGIGADLTDQQWRGVVRQMLAQGFVATSGEYGTLVLTDAAASVLGGTRSVQLRTEPDRPLRRTPAAKSAAKAGVAELTSEQGTLFQALRAWRSAQSKEQGVPAYIVFGDATLLAVAAARPASLAALDGITGIGAKKLEAYGEALVEVVSGVRAGTH